MRVGELVRLFTLVAVLLFTIVPLYAVVSPSASASSLSADSFDEKRLYVSDDPETDPRPPFLTPYLSEVAKAKHQGEEGGWAFRNSQGEFDYSAHQYARHGDYFYIFSDPPVLVGNGEVRYLWVDHPLIRRAAEWGWDYHSFSSARIEQASDIPNTNLNNSLWLGDDEDKEDGEFIRDAQTTILGVNGGAQLDIAGHDNVMMIDQQGRVLTHSDFRVEPPDEFQEGCDMPRPRLRICSEDLNILKEVHRNVTIGNERYNARLQINDPGRVFSRKRVIEYSDAQPDGRTEIIAETRFTVTFVEWKQVYLKLENGTWVEGARYPVFRRENKTVTDSRDAIVTSNQDLRVHQRVIQAPDEQIVVVDFEGPRNIEERRLWQMLEFNHYTVLQGWGMYSMRSYTQGYLQPNDRPLRRVDLPDQFQIRLTARRSDPRVRERIYPGISGIEDGLYPADFRALPPIIEQTDSFRFSNSPAGTPDNVDLRTSEAVGYNAIVFRRAPSQLQGVKDIHGRDISYSTSDHEFHPTIIEGEVISDGQARFTVIDSVTGTPVRGREVLISGGEQRSATTDENGQVIVNRDGNRIQVSMSRTSFLQTHQVYYGASSDSVVMPIRLNLGQVFISAYRGLISILAFLVLYAPFYYIKNHGEKE